MAPALRCLLDVIRAGDRLLGFLKVCRGVMMGLMKKSYLRGWKPPKIVSSYADRVKRRGSSELDLFDCVRYFKPERRSYVSQKENESTI